MAMKHIAGTVDSYRIKLNDKIASNIIQQLNGLKILNGLSEETHKKIIQLLASEGLTHEIYE